MQEIRCSCGKLLGAKNKLDGFVTIKHGDHVCVDLDCGVIYCRGCGDRVVVTSKSHLASKSKDVLEMEVQ